MRRIGQKDGYRAPDRLPKGRVLRVLAHDPIHVIGGEGGNGVQADRRLDEMGWGTPTIADTSEDTGAA